MTTPDTTPPALLAGAVLALDVIDDHVVLLDRAGRIVHANVAWQRFALNNGEERTDWVGVDYVAASAAPATAAGIDDPVSDGVRDVLEGRRRSFRFEYDCHAPDEMRWFRLSAVGADLPGVAAVVTHSDITATRQAERALERLATRDPQTGLANRPAAEQLLGQMLTEGQEASVITATLVAAGTDDRAPEVEVVREAAATLRELFPPPALVARWDEGTLLVAQSGQGVDALHEAGAIVAEALRAVHPDLRVEVAARAVTGPEQVDPAPVDRARDVSAPADRLG